MAALNGHHRAMCPQGFLLKEFYFQNNCSHTHLHKVLMLPVVQLSCSFTFSKHMQQTFSSHLPAQRNNCMKTFLARGPVFFLGKSWTTEKFIFLISESEKVVLNVINWCKMQVKIRNGVYLQVSKVHRFVCNSVRNVFLYIFNVQNGWSNCGRNNCL